MEEKFKKRVIVSEGHYTIELLFRGVYPEFVFGVAQAGDIKGIATLNTRGSSSSVGHFIDPINLDDIHTVDSLCYSIESKNKVVDWPLVRKLYDQALKQMKNEV